MQKIAAIKKKLGKQAGTIKWVEATEDASRYFPQD
jgi:hypothetical protein